MKLFVDSNIFLRLLTKDDQKMFKNCQTLFETIETGIIYPYTSNIVIQEIIYVLTKTYNFSKKGVLKDIGRILTLRNLTLIDNANTRKALAFFQKYNIKYGDCLIATQIPKNTFLCTYDADFNKIPSLSVASPEKIIKQFQSKK